MSEENKKICKPKYTHEEINEIVSKAHNVSKIEKDVVCHLYDNGQILICSGGDLYGSDFIILKTDLLVDDEKFIFPMSDTESTYAILEEKEALHIRELMKEHWIDE